ncbi:MAG: hypothetical protein Q9162_006907 [Coniocarpon cinnabarinum]
MSSAATVAAAHSTSSPHPTYLLPLTDPGAPDIPGGYAYVYLPPPSDPAYSLRFSIQGTSSICRNGSFWTNIPAPGEQFERTKFREYKLKPNFNRSIDIDVPITHAGAFAFFITYTPLPKFSTNTSSQAPRPTRTPTHYVDVSPRLSLRGVDMPLDSLSIFSILSKFMGKNPDDWNKHLNGIGARGYNMVHFTPLMQRGNSNSPYSLYHQLTFDKEHFPNGGEDIANLMSRMERDYGLLAMTDVVLNHTANNSSWLEDHPESGYNLETAPWLEAPYELDTRLLAFSDQLASLGLPTTLNTEADLSRIMEAVKSRVIAEMRLWEYYVVDAQRDAMDSVTAWREGNATLPTGGSGASVEGVAQWSLKHKADWVIDNALQGNDRLGERFRRRVMCQISASLIVAQFGQFSKCPDEHGAYNFIHDILNEVNLQYYRDYDADVSVIVDQIYGRAKYQRLDGHGLKLGPITKESPLIESYFTRLPLNETTKKHNPRSLALVNNGWIWAADAMKDNAGSSSRAYLRREVIPWGDCVKLRYGTGPKDSPFLWDFMGQYARLMAKYFHAFRIDNCHSTPIHVAEYMLDQARKVRPNIAIMAELFSGSEPTDYAFVKRLGLSALIREAMQCWSVAEISKLVHINSGIPLGSFYANDISNLDTADEVSPASPQSPVHESPVHRIRQSQVHALLYDCTHDNETPAQRRDVRDTLPNAALVAFCACATGSVMGYDELYPSLIDLVGERRLYTSPYSEGTVTTQTEKGGVGGIMKQLNHIHTILGQQGYEESFVDHRDQYITMHRVDPQSRRGFFLIAHSAYPGFGDSTPYFEPVHLAGSIARILGAWSLKADGSEAAKNKVQEDKTCLRGLPGQVEELHSVGVDNAIDESVISIKGQFPPGSIAIFETSLPAAEHSEGLDRFVTTGARAAFKDQKLRDLNFILYRCDAEERELNDGKDGCYNVPDHGPLVYAGLQGWWSELKDIVRNNNLGHPLCQNIRGGPWAMEYCVHRLEKISKLAGYDRVKSVADWLRKRFHAVQKLPSYLWPRYFTMVVQTAYNAARDRAVEQMSDGIQTGPQFLKDLALVSVQMSGISSSASLYPQHVVPCLAAGLPHFAVSWMRCWGRDVFISLRGLLLGTGRFANAREHILAFGGVLKHGMIPNLLSSGKITRYNSRDSIWFYLQCIQDYTKMAPNGMLLLQDSVKRRYLPYDDTWFPWDDPRAYSRTSTIEEIIHEAMQRHASGMSFREANAGPAIDSQMRDQGFNLDIHVDWETGMVFGGNQFNCGTWMDKMGESEKAGSKGIPGTPRDGASVEITGLLYSTLTWLSELHDRGQFKQGGVTKGATGPFVSYKDWAAMIKANFERCYYIPLDSSLDAKFDVNPKVINRRGIYKDLYRSGKEFEDYQLRPNYPIAMTVAPQLFDPERALHALSVMDSALLGPTGMATLDPSDWGYRPNYINSDDSSDFAVAKGRNYHSGPEWIWPRGFFLRAMLKFDLMRRKTSEEKLEAYQQVTTRLLGCVDMIQSSPWAGLAELTNYKGSFCGDSCPSQAWSASCMIDLFHDAQQMSAHDLGSESGVETGPTKLADSTVGH